MLWGESKYETTLKGQKDGEKECTWTSTGRTQCNEDEKGRMFSENFM